MGISLSLTRCGRVWRGAIYGFLCHGHTCWLSSVCCPSTFLPLSLSLSLSLSLYIYIYIYIYIITHTHTHTCTHTTQGQPTYDSSLVHSNDKYSLLPLTLVYVCMSAADSPGPPRGHPATTSTGEGTLWPRTLAALGTLPPPTLCTQKHRLPPFSQACRQCCCVGSNLV